jgi:HK97 family phage major capsid protein
MGDEPAEPGQLIRVRGAHEQYDGTKRAATYPMQTSKGMRHPLAGQPVVVGENRRQVDMPSDRDKAISGAWFKWHVASQLAPNVPAAWRLNDHEKDLLQYALRHEKWGGVIGGDCESVPGAVGVKNRTLRDGEIKAIVDDTTSGGLEIAPIVFDDAVILFPVLFGELFPLVNLVEIPRGRRIEGASITNPTLTSGGSVTDNTLIPLNTTASFIAAFDTLIFVVHGAIEFGMDLLSDTPIDLAGVVSQKYGEVLQGWLDEQIAGGDGTTEPEGITVASGTTSVSHSSAAPTVGGYESLLFAVPKRYKQGVPAANVVFCANETTYSRARGIAVGTSDARRVFGMDQENYSLFNHPYKIAYYLANTRIFFAVMRRYRMYRRMGMTLRMDNTGRELMLRNKVLLTMRARFGGQIEDGRAAGVVTDAQA